MQKYSRLLDIKPDSKVDNKVTDGKVIIQLHEKSQENKLDELFADFP